MYEPPLHRNEDLAAQHDLIRAHPLGLLISHGASGLLANAIPFLIDPAASKFGTLRAHVARANPQWRDLETAGEALVVFQGVQHYVTPSWYETKRETGKVVPTWNYVVVQARGKPIVTSDAAWLRDQIEALTRKKESDRAAPWAVGDAPEDFIEQQMRAIVGIEIEIFDIKGKWKVSQNRTAEDRAGVIAGLQAEGDAEATRDRRAILDRQRPRKMPAVDAIGAPQPKFGFVNTAGGQRGRPYDVIKSELYGLPFPASSELVLEGEMVPGETQLEGPFGEFMGYYASEASQQPIVRIKRDYFRHDPIITLAIPSRPPSNFTVARAAVKSSMIWDECEKAGLAGIRGVWCHEAGAGRLFNVISIKQMYPGHASQAGMLAANCQQVER